MQMCQSCQQPFYMLNYAKMLPCMHSLYCDQCMVYYAPPQCLVCGYTFNSVTRDPALEALQIEISEFYYAQLSDQEKENRAYVVAVKLNERLKWLAGERTPPIMQSGQEEDSEPTEWRHPYTSDQNVYSSADHTDLAPESHLYQPLLQQPPKVFPPAPQSFPNPLAKSQPGAPPPLEGFQVPDLSRIPMSELGQPVNGLWICRYCGCERNQGTRCKDCRRVNLSGGNGPLPMSIQALLQFEEENGCCPCLACSIF